jgi:hypothetical protein
VAKPLGRKSISDARSSNAPDKALEYEALAALNRHFAQILEHLNRLREFHLFDTRFRRESLQACRAMIEETRA